MKRVATIFLFTLALSATGDGQSTNVATEKDKYWTEVIAELRLTRHVIEQLKKELKSLQVATIRIRVQQDFIASKQARLDSVKSEAQITEDALGQVRDRVKKLESIDLSGLDEGEQKRAREEIEDAKKEIDREQQRLDSLRYQDSQLTTEIQTERLRLAEMIAALEATSTDLVSDRSENQLKRGGPNGPPNK